MCQLPACFYSAPLPGLPDGGPFFHTPKVGKSYAGTGDMFAACFTGALMQEKTMEEAASLACRFTLRAIEETAKNPAHWYGVKFETALPWLINQLF